MAAIGSQLQSTLPDILGLAGGTVGAFKWLLLLAAAVAVGYGLIRFVTSGGK